MARGHTAIDSRLPVEGQSHWCEGKTRFGFRCRHIVRNENDHCEAGHVNKIRVLKVGTLTLRDQSVTSRASFDIDELAATVTPEIVAEAERTGAGLKVDFEIGGKPYMAYPKTGRMIPVKRYR